MKFRRLLLEKFIEYAFVFCAAIFILAILLISFFIFKQGIPVMVKVGLGGFLLNLDWSPTHGSYGIAAMLVGSLLVTAGALVWAVPISVMTAVLMAEIAPRPVGRWLAEMISLLAGIPSVVYGFFGLMVIVPFIRGFWGVNGLSIMAGALVLGIMILPTIINISRDAIVAVPDEYKLNSLALGASRHQTIARVILPSARSGIITSIVLGMGRAIGETMAVVMVTGNAAIIPDSILGPVRTMTSNIVLEMGYASGDHRSALFATGVILFLLIVVLNLSVNIARRRGAV